MKELFPYILAILAGIFSTLESSINGYVGKETTPKIATIYSLIAGLTIMILITLPADKFRTYRNIYKFNRSLLLAGAFAGILGALIVYFVAATLPTLGVTVTMTLVVAAQILSGLYIDLIIFKQSLDFYKILGAFTVILGIYFITLRS